MAVLIRSVASIRRFDNYNLTNRAISCIYKPKMKYKRLIIATSAVVAIATTVGVVQAATHNYPPVPTATKQATTVAPTPTVTESTPVDTTPAASTESIQTTPTAPVISQADQNRSQLQSDVTTVATVTAQHLSRPLTNNELTSFVNVQWVCIDKLTANHPGYDVPYDTLLTNSAFIILKPTQDNSGMTVYKYFDNVGTCRIFSTQPS